MPRFFNLLTASTPRGGLIDFCFELSIFLAVGLFSIVEFSTDFFLKSTIGPFAVGTYLVFEYLRAGSPELIFGVFFSNIF